MNYRDLTKKLRRCGCEFARRGAGSHEIWWHPGRRLFTSIPKHTNRDLAVGTVRGIVRDLGIPKPEFDRA